MCHDGVLGIRVAFQSEVRVDFQIMYVYLSIVSAVGERLGRSWHEYVSGGGRGSSGCYSQLNADM